MFIIKYNKKLNYKTFTEKLSWLKDNDNLLLKTYCSDKINLRTYCKDQLGENLCPKIYDIYNSPQEINIDTVSQHCMLKCNHGSGYNIILNNRKLSTDEYELLNIWYNTDYSTFFNELQYKNIKHKIFTEELLNIICEYKVWCFHGIPKFTQCIFYDNLDLTLFRNTPTYKREWSRHDVLVDTKFNFIKHWQFNLGRPNYNENKYLEKYYKKYCMTNQYNKILEYSTKLSNNFKFVRVDFYRDANEQIYLSELTFTPSAGQMQFNNYNTNYQIGKLLHI